MLVRSMVGGALFVGLIYFVQNPTELVVLRFLQGLTSGTVAAATALVAAETPRARIGWALGVVTSAVALGGAIGPVVGGFAGAVFGLRVVFLVSGGLLLLAVIPVFLVVRETPIVRTAGARVGALALINQQPGQRHALAVLIAAQGLVSLVTSGAQQLVVLRLLEMVQTGVAFVSGIAFGLAGLATSLAAIGYTRFSQRLGYVKTAAAASSLLALAVLLTGAAPTPLVVVVAAALTGLFGGVVLPATASMLGLETPHQAQSTVFGINASSVAMGFFLGPLIGGTVAAATSDVSSALYVIAGLSMALAALLSTQAREPAR